MPKLLKSLKQIIDWLSEQNIPYMVFGGIANAIYGNPRQTYDIDIKIHIENNSLNNFIKKIQSIGKIVPSAPHQFIKDTNVLPIEINGVRIDIVLANLPFEKEAIKRSQRLSYKNSEMNVCTLEDFIIQKAVSERDKDWNDIEKVIKLNKDNINWDYLLTHCKKLSNFLSRSDILDKIEAYRNEE